ERFDPAVVLRAIERYRVTVLAAVSTQFVMMLNSAAIDEYDLSSLQIMFTGGEMDPYERAKEFEDRTGAHVLQFYGSNETGAILRPSTPTDTSPWSAARPTSSSAAARTSAPRRSRVRSRRIRRSLCAGRWRSPTPHSASVSAPSWRCARVASRSRSTTCARTS